MFSHPRILSTSKLNLSSPCPLSGSHECEVLSIDQREEEESNYAWRNCSKNPGHTNFIPVKELCMNHLPEWSRKSITLRYIQYVSAMTVRLKVGYTSPARPDGYPFYRFRDTVLPHSGSGLVWNIQLESGPCRCSECEHNTSPCQTCCRIDVRTARHVIYNDEEARATQVNLFDDDEESRTDGRMKTLFGSKVIEIHDEGDHCTLQCFTHDQLLIKELKRLEALYKYLPFRFDGKISAWPKSHGENLCVIVSHPHGQSKRVTVGEMKSCTKVGPMDQREFTYSTDTCPG